MTMLDKIEERATGMCKPDEFMRTPAGVTIEVEQDIDSKPAEFARTFEHELRMRCFVRFWANKAQYPDARQMAERRMAHLIYADVLAALGEIQHAISDGDRMAALTRCAELQATLTR